MPAEILTDAFFDSFDSTLVGLDAAETLPPACYTDASFYEFEKEALFNHEWLCVGRVDQVRQPGDFFTTRIVGEPIVVARARRIEKFLSQPFHVAEVFTGSPGIFVPVAETVRSFKAIIDGQYDHLPEAAFYMVGTIDDAVKKSESMKVAA